MEKTTSGALERGSELSGRSVATVCCLMSENLPHFKLITFETNIYAQHIWRGCTLIPEKDCQEEGGDCLFKYIKLWEGERKLVI